jgi:hypothetical protein
MFNSAKYNKAYRKKNKKKIATYMKKWWSENPHLVRKSNLSRWSITPEQYDEMAKKQNHRCLICNRHQSELTRALAVDHDHSCCPGVKKSCGKCIRGLLCPYCNLAIGNMKESSELLRKAADYLDAFNMRT